MAPGLIQILSADQLQHACTDKLPHGAGMHKGFVLAEIRLGIT
jgi:hypothetical protein